ncbi:MAG: T9SS type A sorting domain-containing protein [Ignavibacteria bacterium]|nr:T9SS type A sorting domain-containing protein [Ignavibacteria bacterium]MBI3766056.1 T9SS type A sorting domain-containing protein [Ignavibacteriales bacterium]
MNSLNGNTCNCSNTIFRNRQHVYDVYLTLTNDGRIHCNIQNEPVSYTLISRTRLNLHTWYHVAFTCDESVMKIYVNGILDTARAGPESHDWSINYITTSIGSNTADGSDWAFNGIIDELRISNKARVASEFNVRRHVTIDIKPGSYPNSINCSNLNGIIPVAILTTPDFDASRIDHTTVTFGPTKAKEIHYSNGLPIRHEEDVDGDGDMDLVLHFKFSDTGIVCGDSTATLLGETYSGEKILGSDNIRTIEGARKILPSRVQNPLSAIPKAFTLNPNYPNPFNPTTAIRYQIPVNSNVTLKIFNILGQEIKTLINEMQNAGDKSVEWNSTNNSRASVASGVYFYRLEAVDVRNPTNRFIKARKMVLVR